MISSSTRAKNRLLKDLKEIENNPLETVYAQPLQDNLFHWYATVLAPKESRYHGIILNLSIVFPENYPNDPPKVVCSSRIHHRHVFSTWICLDMLKTHYSSEPYSGWSTSYSCLSLLLQLQSFLLDEDETFDYLKSSEPLAISASRLYVNEKIGHDPSNGKIWPCAPHWNVEEILKSKYVANEAKPRKREKAAKFVEGVEMELEDFIEQSRTQISKKKRKKMNRLEKARRERGDSGNFVFKKIEKMKDLPNEILLHILSHLSVIDLNRVSASSHYMRRLCENKMLTTERELICFHSKVTYLEDTLGVGLIFETNENKDKKIINKNGKLITSISSPLDLISKSAYLNDMVSKSVWGIPTQQWVPIYINKEHGNFEELKQALQRIVLLYPSLFGKNDSAMFNSPEIYIEFMCKLMNTMVVEIMKGKTHASIKALYGYMYFHRWLIYLVQAFPKALHDIEEQVKSFVANDDARKKSNCPNIGEFLPKLAVLGPSGLTWDYVKSSLLEESSVRKQLWVIKMFPELANIKDASDEYRCAKSWEANNVSCKLIMFHVFFLRNIVESYNDLSLEEFGRLYDNNFGCPPKTKSGELLEDVLQSEIFKIQNISNFQQYFEYVGLPNLKSKKAVAQYLRNCVFKSEKRGYHKRFFNAPGQYKSKPSSTKPSEKSPRSSTKLIKH